VKAARERLLKRNVRVVAYTSQGAYSGGYYIAMGAGHGNFFADPLADVANIGTIMAMFNTAGVGELVGVTENIISTGPLKSTGHQWEKLTPSQRAMVQDSVNDSFMEFLGAVSEGRQIDMQTLMKESQLPVGRTNGAWFSARRAVAKGLLDGVIPIESLYIEVVEMLPNKEQWSGVSLVEYRAHTSAFDDATKKAGRVSGVFLDQLFSAMTRRDAPMRSERP
jgi:ClpP class serine protease